MLITYKNIGIPFRRYHFSEISKKNLVDYFVPTSFVSCQTKSSPFLFIRHNRHSLANNLDLDESEIFDNFSKSTRNLLRRSVKDFSFEFSAETEIDAFIKFYNTFANIRGLPLLKPGLYKKLKKNSYKICYVRLKNDMVVMHLYLLSEDYQVVSLLYSASNQRDFQTKEMRRVTGLANRFLHWQSMLYFKKNGYKVYDWGGYAYGTQDPELIGINKFKKSFNGKMVEVFNYYSIPYYSVTLLRGFVYKTLKSYLAKPFAEKLLN